LGAAGFLKLFRHGEREAAISFAPYFD